MRFLIDECTGPAVSNWLSKQGHDVLSVYAQAKGANDEQVISMAKNGDRILITNDKDFGEKVYKDKHQHCGIILLRLEDERPATKIEVLSHLLSQYSEKIPGAFTVVSEQRVKFAKIR